MATSTNNMNGVCAADHHHSNKYHALSPKKSLRDIDIPPRKLLTRGARPAPLDDTCMLSPRFSSADETMLQRFLPCNGGDDDDADPYASDHFRMFEFKVRRCTRSRSHDWTDCPFAHPGEKARRRDPRRYHYSGTVCSEYRRGGCSRGDNCEFAHGVFECWLHPARYRTEACKDGKNCKRKVCFFAHTARELRVLPLHSPEISPAAERKYRNAGCSSNHCCLFCCHNNNSSPTSTLLGMSHLSSPPLSRSSSVSPPLSPIKHRSLSGLSPFSRFLSSEHASPVSPQFNYSGNGNMSYKEVLNELMSSLEAMKFSEAASASVAAVSPVSACDNYRNAPWVDVYNNNGSEDQQFILSPSPSMMSNFNATPSPVGSSSRDSFTATDSPQNLKINDNGWSCPDPDLGWVNDLLM